SRLATSRPTTSGRRAPTRAHRQSAVFDERPVWLADRLRGTEAVPPTNATADTPRHTSRWTPTAVVLSRCVPEQAHHNAQPPGSCGRKTQAAQPAPARHRPAPLVPTV